MSSRTQYYQLQNELEALEKGLRASHGVWFGLTDPTVDAENVLPLKEEDGEEYWAAMYRAACMQAGMMAEDKGLDVNALLGRVIY